MILIIKIITKAPYNKILGWFDNALKIKIKSEPKKGKANKELIKFLSEVFHTPKNGIKIIKGEKSKFKLISINEDSEHIKSIINNITEGS